MIDRDAVEREVPVALWRHDTRPGDAIAPALYYPAECEVCGQPPMPQSVYCSERCAEIMTGKRKSIVVEGK